jgi:hypothetical protein
VGPRYDCAAGEKRRSVNEENIEDDRERKKNGKRFDGIMAGVESAWLSLVSYLQTPDLV